MGIHGLWPILEPTSTSITLDALEGKRLAIDVSFWLYQAQYGYGAREHASKSPHLQLMLRRIAKLLFYKIRPVFVFDGENIPRFKRQILRDRTLQRHLKEITVSKEQKRLFERVAKDQLDSAESSLDGFNEAAASLKKFRKVTNVDQHSSDFVLPTTSFLTNETLEVQSASSSDSESDLNLSIQDIYSSKLDAQISKLEEAKERGRDARLCPSEIPDDSRQFSQFQLQRLVQKNKINTKLKKLKTDRIRNTFELTSNGENKLIITDKQRRTHVISKRPDVQIIEDEQNAEYQDLTWPEFLHNKQIITSFLNNVNQEEAMQNAIFASLNQNDKNKAEAKPKFSEHTQMNKEENSSDNDDNDFIDVDELKEFEHEIVSQVYQSNSDISLIEINEYSADELEKQINDKDDAIVKMEPENKVLNEEGDDYFPNNQMGLPFHLRWYNNNESDGIYADCQKFLAALGLPFLQAPAEAEAQCVVLEQLNLVDGVVSDDSDVWLFGATQVYKNMFSRKKHVQKYSSKKIRKKLGLGRSEFIQLGMLSGGDYTRGLEQVGMVTALELVSEFVSIANTKNENYLDTALQTLQKIKEWILSKRRNNKDLKSNKLFLESSRRIRLRKIIEANNPDEYIKLFPNVEVLEAYAKPLTNNSTQKFSWSRVNFNLLDMFLQEKLGLTRQQVSQMTFGALQRWDEFMAQQTQTYQAKITDFVCPLSTNFNGILGASTSNAAPTKRVQKALEKLKSSIPNDTNNDNLLLSSTKTRKTQSSVRRKKQTSRRKGSKTTTLKKSVTKVKRPINFNNLSEDSSSTCD